MMVSRSQLLYINSSGRIKGVPYDFTVDIPWGLIKTDKMGRIRVTVRDCVINRSFNAVQTNNNTFRVNGVPYSIPVGSYDVKTLKTAIATLLFNWVITYDALTNKYRYQTPAGTPDQTITFDNACCYLLGFNMTDRPVVTAAAPVMSSIPVKISQESTLVVHCDLPKAKMSVIDNFGPSGSSSTFSTALRESNVLVKLPLNAPPYDNLVYDGDDFGFYLSVQHVNEIRFWVTDENSRALQLAYDWTITLRLTYEDTEEPVATNVARIADYLKLMLLGGGASSALTASNALTASKKDPSS